MKATIDAAGRLVIPKEIRRLAGLEAGAELEIRFRDGVVEIEPVAAPVNLVRDGHLLVAAHEGEGPPLTPADVARIRAEIERERFGI